MTTWEEKTSNTYWTGLQGGWRQDDETETWSWTSGNNTYLTITQNIGWGETYTPNKMRITFINTPTLDFLIELGDGTRLIDVYGYMSGDKVDLNFSPFTGFQDLFFKSPNTYFNVTKIEFGFESVGPAATAIWMMRRNLSTGIDYITTPEWTTISGAGWSTIRSWCKSQHE
jgi:hypothetical protein